MWCTNCGEELEEASRFCRKCGSPVPMAKHNTGNTYQSQQNEQSETKETEKKNDSVINENLIIARREKAKENWNEAEKYYNLVEQSEPSNIEAIFYGAYAKAKCSLVDSDVFKREEVFRVLNNCISMTADYYMVENEDELKGIIRQISEDIFAMVKGSYVFNQRKNGYGVVLSSDKDKTIVLFNKLEIEFCNALNRIIKKYPDGDKRTIAFYEMAIRHAEYALLTYALGDATEIQKKIMDMHIEWNRIDSCHMVPDSAPVATLAGENNNINDDDISKHSIMIGVMGVAAYIIIRGILISLTIRFTDNAMVSMLFEILECVIAMPIGIIMYEKRVESANDNTGNVMGAIGIAAVMGGIVKLILDYIPGISSMGILLYILHLFVFAVPGYIYLNEKK